MNHRTLILPMVLTCLLAFVSAGRADDSAPAAHATPLVLKLTASTANASPGFQKFLYSFPLASPARLTGLSGSISITSKGQGFAQALVSVQSIPPGLAFPRPGEEYGSYATIRARYPAMKPLAHFIIKQPAGTNAATLPIELTFPAGLPVSGNLVIVLDGSVRRVGGAFTMSSDLAAHLSPLSSALPTAKVVLLDDEFCFGRPTGGQRATTQTAPQAAFMKVVPVQEAGTLLAVYGDISDSTFGPGSLDSFGSGPGPWAIANDYYVYHHCLLRPGLSGPSDFYATIPPDATKLDAVEMRGCGQVALQQPVYRAIPGVALRPGDCLVHLIHMTAASDQGGIDAENQVFALVQPDEKAPPQNGP